MTDSTANNITPASNNTVSVSQTASNANSSAVQVSPHHATGAAARVLNTPELLDLILSKLPLKDLLLSAPLTCRGFKTSIDSSPTTNKRLEFAVIDLLSTESLSFGFMILWGRSGVALTFKDLPIERCLSSPSFRKLRSPNTSFDYAYVRANHPRPYRFKSNEKSPSAQNGEPVSIAELLEPIVSKGTVKFVLLRAISSTT